jgi:LAO/AO transport system kinase
MTSEITDRLLSGDRRSLTRVITWVENDYPEARDAMRELFPHTGKAHVVGITGPTGSGKSTLVGGLAREYRKMGRSVGIIAVDPTSPFSHGALLGDRIRMQDLTSDPEVFIRSMATRGALGGLAAATNDIVAVLDASGKDMVLVETVGAGQDEVEVADTAHTSVVISIPGDGDDMQAIKAGILEIADILVVNKADLTAAEAVYKQLHIFMDLARHEGWEVPIIKTVSSKGEGIEKLLEAIDNHRTYLQTSGRLEKMRRQRARRQLLAAAQADLLANLLATAESNGRLDKLIEAVADRELDPRTAAEMLIANS